MKINAFNKESLESNEREMKANLERLADYLNGKVIRFNVGQGRNMGHQGNTINSIRRFINLGLCTGNIELLVPKDEDIIKKLKTLLPNFTNSEGFYLDYKYPIRVHFYNGKLDKLEDNILCFSGGDDISERCIEYSKYYVIVQPYHWDKYKPRGLGDNKSSRIYIYDGKKHSSFELVGEISEFTFKMSFPSKEDLKWDYWKKECNTITIEYVQEILNYIDTSSISKPMFFPVYGIHDETQNIILGFNVVVNIINMMAYTQRKHNQCFNGNIIIGIISDLEESFWKDIRNFYKLESEFEYSNKCSIAQNLEVAREFIRSIGKSGDIEIIQNNSLEEIRNLFKKYNENHIFVINISKLPQILYQYLYSIASLPAVFEGEGTAPIAINLGKPFIKLPTFKPEGLKRKVEEVDGYPKSEEFQEVAAKFTKAGKNINNLFPRDLGTYMNDIEHLCELQLDIKTKDNITKHFGNIQEIYTRDINDKILRALNFLMIMEGKKLIKAEATLESLYNKIQSSVHNNVLNLMPEAISDGRFFDYLSGVMGESNLSVGTQSNPVNIVFTPSHDKITITGDTNAFTEFYTETTFEFTTAEDQSSVDSKMTIVLGKHILEGVSWFTLDDSRLWVTVPGGSGFITGEVDSNISIGGQPVNFSIAFPTMDGNSITIKGDLSQKPLSINSIFQLLGGVNFVSTFPESIKSVAQLALQNMEIGYNYSDKAVTSFKVELNNSSKWHLFGKLSLNELHMIIYIPGPKSQGKVQWFASTTACIGKNGKIDVGISYPDTSIQASLSEDSEAIPIGDLLTFFVSEDTTIDLASNLADFSMNVIPRINDRPTTYFISAGIKLEQWDLSIANIKFGLTDINFKIRDEGDGVTVWINALVTLFSNNPELEFIMNLTAEYKRNGKWIFSGKQSEKAIKVKDIINTYISNWDWNELPTIDITNLEFTVETNSNNSEDSAYCVGGTVEIKDWDTPLGKDFTSTITGKFGHGDINNLVYSKAEFSKYHTLPTMIEEKQIMLIDNKPQRGYYGEISANIKWQNIDLTVLYKFDPKYRCYSITWGIFSGNIEEKMINKTKHKIATLKFTQTTTIGSLIEIMVEWATGSKFGLTSPWNILDKIPLSNFELVWDFTDNTVNLKVNIGPINLGFVEIKSIGLSYKQDPENTSKKYVYIDFDASFIWGDKVPVWDITEPEKAPSPNGNGDKYLDLRLLAMGQHIKLNNIEEQTTIQDVITSMEKMPEPSADKIPEVSFYEDNSWLFGVDFGLIRIDSNKENSKNGYVLTMQAIFNDPNLYALRIALDGDAAKIFKNLDFQIMYRKINDNLGVYKGEITLPDVMRYLSIGAYSITLPVFGIELYTNGDFKVDLGFPYNSNFSRSFSIEAIIPPGIPMIGSGGVYFGKLPQEVVSNLPQTDLGNFNPILVFGFGAQVGVGKTIQYGILKAGLSLTVFGILEGILAKWNPYSDRAIDTPKEQIQGDYYFLLNGTFGIIGNIFGIVDFAVIKADVNITVKVYAQINFEAYKPIPITVLASLDAKASISINMGLFKINIHFSFSVKIKETITIGELQDPSDAPWNKKELYPNGRMAGSLQGRLRYYDNGLLGLIKSNVHPDWSRFKKQENLITLEGFVGFGLTVAGDKAFIDKDSIDKTKQETCYIVNLFIKSVPSAEENDDLSQKKSIGLENDTSFETLAKMILRWAIASIVPVQPDNSTQSPIEYIDSRIVRDQEILDLLSYLSNTEDNPVPISIDEIEEFLHRHIQFAISLPDTSIEHYEDAAFFPMALDLLIERGEYNGKAALKYNFRDYNSINKDFLKELREYFNQLALQVQEESSDKSKKYSLSENDGMSVASFIFSDYFVFIMRQMLQAFHDSLRTFKKTIIKGKNCNDIIDWVNTNEQNVEECNLYGLFDLFEGNAQQRLTPGVTIKIPYISYNTKDRDTFISISSRDNMNSFFNAKELAMINSKVSGILLPNQKIIYPGKEDYSVNNKVTLETIAVKVFEVTIDELLNNSNILSSDILLQSNTIITLPPINHIIKDRETLSTISAFYAVNIADIAGINRENTFVNPVKDFNGNIVDLFYSDSNIDYINILHLKRFNVGEVIKEIQRTKAIEHISAMVSRYYFHGLRMPTKNIIPKQDGMWVENNDFEVYEAGLFSLTGQQILIPELTEEPLKLSISKPNLSINWLLFENNQQTLTYIISKDNNKSDYLRIQALKNYAVNNSLDIDLDFIGTKSKVEVEHSSYPVISSVPLESTSIIKGEVLPFTEDSKPRLWYLPDAMKALVETSVSTIAHNPCFKLESQRYDQATGAISTTSIKQSLWSSSIEFKIKKLTNATLEGAYENTYEIMSVDGKNVLLLERMIQDLRLSENISILTLGYYNNSALCIGAGSNITMGISQVNLSTTTKPPTSKLMNMEDKLEEEKINLLNEPSEFIKLLWKAGITRSGGFYLYYSDDKVKGKSIPDAIFNDDNEAIVTLIVMYKVESQSILHSYMNAILIGDPIELANSTIIAKSEPVCNNCTHIVEKYDSLASIASSYYSNVSSIITKNSNVQLAQGVNIVIENGIHQVMINGEKLIDIAKYYHTESEDIKSVNPNILQEQWNDGLNSGTIIRLPKIQFMIGNLNNATSDNKISEIAKFYGCSIDSIAGTNKDIKGLLKEGQRIENIETGPLNEIQYNSAGVQVIGAVREALPVLIDVKDNPEKYAVSYLQTLYTMLGYKVIENQDFDGSNMALPLGPIGKSVPKNYDKIRNIIQDDDEKLEYETTMYYKNITKGKIDNPYLYNGKILEIEYSWNDIYGNRIVTSFDNMTSTVNKTHTLIGYTDTLIGISQWPGIAANWNVSKSDSADDFVIVMNISFDESSYSDPNSNKNKIALNIYNKLLMQLEDPNGIGLCFKTSLLLETLDVSCKLNDLREFIVGIINFIQGSKETIEKSIVIFSQAHKKDINKNQVFKLTCEFIINRLNGVVEDDYSGICGIKEVSADITPMMESVDKDSSLGLKKFTENIEETLSEPDKYIITIGVGEDRYSTINEVYKNIWVIRIGKSLEEGIYLSNNNCGKPQIYARRPLANNLINQTVEIHEFVNINNYDYDENELIGEIQSLAIRDINLDNWMERLFGDIDNILTPQYISSILIIDKNVNNYPYLQENSFMTEFKNVKELLAKFAKTLLVPIYKDQEVTDLSAVQETVYEELLMKLSNLYLVRAAVSFGMNVSAYINENESPRLYGNIGWNNNTNNNEVILTSPKLELKTKECSPLNFLVEFPISKENVHSELSCNLYYKGTNIEHQIQTLNSNDIKDYVASSWISFVNSDVLDNLKVQLGKFNIPILIQSIPESLNVLTQIGLVNSSDPEFENWRYAFTYSQKAYYPQDTMHVKVIYNLKNKYNKIMSNNTKIIEALAQFINAQNTLDKLLKDTVSKVTVNSVQKDIDEGAKALGAYLKIIKNITEIIKINSEKNQMEYLNDVNAKIYQFTIKEAEETITIKCGESFITKDCWVVRIKREVDSIFKFDDYPYLSIKGYTPKMFKKTDTSIAYWYCLEKSEDIPLTSSDAQNIKEREVVMPSTPIIEFQSATSSIFLRRNEDEENKIREEFIYETPEVTFPNSYLPKIEKFNEIDISKIRNGKIVKQSIKEHLRDLFEMIFNNTTGEYVLQMECKYRYSINKEFDYVKLPIFLLVPSVFKAKKDCYLENELILNISKSISEWINDNNLSREKAALCFDLTIMSNMTIDSIPMLKLGSLILDIDKIVNCPNLH